MGILTQQNKVKCNHRSLSDLDVMIKGEQQASHNDLEQLRELFNNSNLSYIVNIVDFYSLTKNFYGIIDMDLVEI